MCDVIWSYLLDDCDPMTPRGKVREEMLAFLDQPLDDSDRFKNWGESVEAQRAIRTIASQPGAGPEFDLRAIQ